MTPTPGHRKAFVVGCVRSGTSWVRSIFLHHPFAVSAIESHVFVEVYEPIVRFGVPWPVLLEIYDQSVASGKQAGVHRWVDRTTFAELVELARDRAPEGDRRHAAIGLVDDVLTSFFLRHGGTPAHILVEKTPNHLFFADVILANFPDARIIEVVRDGRDVCVSMQQRALSESWLPATRSEQITRWVEAVRHGQSLRSRPELAERWLVVRFEAMKRDPASEIARVLAFLDLPRSPELLGTLVDRTAFTSIRKTGEGLHQRKGQIGDWQEFFGPGELDLFRRLAGPEFLAAGYSF